MSATWTYDYKNKFWVALKGKILIDIRYLDIRIQLCITIFDYIDVILFLISGPQLSRVPKKPASGCPKGTHEYWSNGGTCCSTHGCCWDRCVLTDPNDYGDFLKGTGAKWVRNNAKAYWMAQVNSNY